MKLPWLGKTGFRAPLYAGKSNREHIMKLTLLLICFSLAAFAQTPAIPKPGTNGAGAGDVQSAPNVAKPETKQVTAESRAKWWRGQTESAIASEALKQAQDKITAVVEQMTKECGAQPIQGQDGEPTCPPPPPKPAEPPKK